MIEVVNEEPVTEIPVPAEVVIEAAPVEVKPGENTDSVLLLASLTKEREKRRQLEVALEAERLKNQQAPEAVSDEGRALQKQFDELKGVVLAREEREQLSNLESKHPALRDKGEEFEQFRVDNPGMKLATAAKAFLVEHDLLEAPQPRKGLEQAQGGGRVPVQQDGMSPEEADTLMKNNYNEYARRLKNGTLKVRT